MGGWIWPHRVGSWARKGQNPASTGVNWSREGMGLPAPVGRGGRGNQTGIDGGELVGARVDLPASGG